MAVHKYVRARDGATVYVAVYQDPVGRRRVEKAASVPAGASRRAHERAETKARALADRRRLEVENGTWEPPEGHGRRRRGRRGRNPGVLTFGRLVRMFLDEYEPRSGKPDYYLYRAKAWLSFFRPDMPAGAISPADVEAFRRARSRKWAPSTVKKDLVSLGTLFRWAVARGLLERNPAAPELVRRPREPRGATGYLSREQERVLLENSPPWLRRVILWAINTGMDRGEVVNLTWDDVDLEAGSVFAPRAKTGIPRTLPLNDTLRAILRDCRRVRNIASGNRVFLGPKGEPLTVNQVRMALRRAYRSAGFDVRGRFRIFRHTFASRLAMAGVDMATIARLMGHSTSTITDRYAHLSPRHLQGAMALLDVPGAGETAQRAAQKNEANILSASPSAGTVCNPWT